MLGWMRKKDRRRAGISKIAPSGPTQSSGHGIDEPITIQAAFVLHHRDQHSRLTGRRTYGLILANEQLCCLPGGMVERSPIKRRSNKSSPQYTGTSTLYPSERLWHYSLRSSVVSAPVTGYQRSVVYPCTLELFGSPVSWKDLPRASRFADAADLSLAYMSPPGSFVLSEIAHDDLVFNPNWVDLNENGMLGTQAAALLRRYVLADNEPPPPHATALKDSVASLLRLLDMQGIAYIHAILIARVLRLGILADLDLARGTQANIRTRLGETHNESLRKEEKRVLDEASRTVALLEENLDILSRHEQRILDIVDRIRDFRFQLYHRDAEARLAAELACAATDTVARAVCAQTPFAGLGAVDTFAAIESFESGLKSRVRAVHELAEQIRIELDSDQTLRQDPVSWNSLFDFGGMLP